MAYAVDLDDFDTGFDFEENLRRVGKLLIYIHMAKWGEKSIN